MSSQEELQALNLCCKPCNISSEFWYNIPLFQGYVSPPEGEPMISDAPAAKKEQEGDEDEEPGNYHFGEPSLTRESTRV